MKKRSAIIAIFSLLSFVFSQPAPSSAPQRRAGFDAAAKSSPSKFALLVGIDDYTDAKIKDLSGCENDVKLMRELLSETYGFEAQTEIRELLSSNPDGGKPTRQAILDNFDAFLIANAREYLKSRGLEPEKDADKGATVIFYYSGHGSHLPDNENRDEPDGEDETILPMDADFSGSKDIRDDDFDARFAELKKFTTNISFIFDSCHSGTMTRGAGERSVPRLSAALPLRGDGIDATLNENMDSAGEKYVTISGSLPNEKAQEDWLPNPKTKKPQMNGYLTYYLVQTLREMPGASYREAMARVKAAVQKRNSDQHPQIEGDIERPVFGAAVSGRANTVDVLAVKKADKKSILTINAGKIVGAYPGGAAAIYKKAGDGEPFAVGEIIEPTDDLTATVEVPKTAVPESARVVLATPFFGTDKRVVALDLKPQPGTPERNDAGLQMIKRLANNLRKNDYVTPRTLLDPLSENPRKWNVAVVRTTFGEFKRGNRQPLSEAAAKPPEDKDEIYYLSSVNGNPVYNFYVKADNAKAADAIQGALERFVRADNLRTLRGESASLNEGLRLKIVRLKSVAPPPPGSTVCAAVEGGALENSFLNPGEFFIVEISNNTGEALFPYLYNINAGGEVKLFYEPPADGDILRNNVSMLTWGAKKCDVFRANVPYGTETFKLIAASKRYNGKLLENPALAQAALRDGDPLVNLLARAGTNTRGVESGGFEFNGWATTSIELEIREK